MIRLAAPGSWAGTSLIAPLPFVERGHLYYIAERDGVTYEVARTGDRRWRARERRDRSVMNVSVPTRLRAIEWCNDRAWWRTQSQWVRT